MNNLKIVTFPTEEKPDFQRMVRVIEVNDVRKQEQTVEPVDDKSKPTGEKYEQLLFTYDKGDGKNQQFEVRGDRFDNTQIYLINELGKTIAKLHG